MPTFLITVCLILAVLLQVGCDASPFEKVAAETVRGGEVRIWTEGGQLHSGENRILLEITGEGKDRVKWPPRLRFEKSESGAGYRVEAEARIKRISPGRYEGTITFPESGRWRAPVDIAGEEIVFELEVN